MLFWILFGIDAAVALVTVYFFFVGLADGSVSSFNGTLWLAILAVLAAVLGGGWVLKANRRRGMANAVLAILALPGFLYGLFILSVVVFQPNWR